MSFVPTLARCWRSPSTPAPLPGPELQRPDNSRTLATPQRPPMRAMRAASTVLPAL